MPLTTVRVMWNIYFKKRKKNMMCKEKENSLIIQNNNSHSLIIEYNITLINITDYCLSCLLWSSCRMSFKLRIKILYIKKVCFQSDKHTESLCDSRTMWGSYILYMPSGCLLNLSAPLSEYFPLQLFLDTLEAWRASIQEGEWLCCAEARPRSHYMNKTEVFERNSLMDVRQPPGHIVIRFE